MEGADVEPRFAERGADAANEARRILVDDVEHVAVEIGLDLDPEHLDEARFVVAEQRARDRAVARFGRHGDAHERVIVAIAVVAHFADVEAAFAREVRGVDHVHAVRIAAHQAGEHRGGDRLEVQLGRRSLDLDRNLGEIVVRELADEAAELFGEAHIGAQLRRFLGRQAGDVERVGDAAGEEVIRQLLGDLNGDIDLRLVGRRAEVRRADEVRRSEQRVIGRRRLGREHVECGARDMAAVERLFQRRFVDQPAACAVDDAYALLGLGDILLRQDIARLVGQRRVQRDEIGLGEQSVEIGLFDAEFDRALGGQEGVEGDDLHAEAEGALGDDAADIAAADQAERLRGQLDAHEVVLRPFARLRQRVRFGDLAREREHHRDRVLGGGDAVAEGRVHHDDALLRRRRDVDIVDTDPGAADDLQVRRGGEDVGGDLGGRADREPVIGADHRDQFVLGLAGDDVDVDAAFLEDRGGLGVHLVADEDFGCGHWFFL